MVAAGFLLVAVCPAPSLTKMARGDVSISVGLMVILAASSALLAPLLLALLLPFVMRASLKIDAVKILSTLMLTQILPLAAGLLVRHKRPQLAARLQKPANLLTSFLALTVFVLVISLEYRTLVQIRLRAYFGICLLVLLSLGGGWILSSRGFAIRKAVALTTAARNVGVALVIATASFPDTVAVTAVIVFAIVQTAVLALIAAWSGGRALTHTSQPMQAQRSWS